MRTNLRMTYLTKSGIQQKLSLMIPGPTPVPEKVLQALSKHPIGHRSKEFQELVESTTKNLQWLHQTQNDVLTITGSGTAAMEAGIINTLSKGDKVICGENGKFGERWVKVAKEFGLEVIIINAEWGTALNPKEFKKILIVTYNWKNIGGGHKRAELLKEIFSKEAIVHISKFCVISRSKSDFAKAIPNAQESPLSKPTECISIFNSFFLLGIFINS